MTNPLIAARDKFAETHPERRVTIAGREWGVVEAGADGPCLLLIPGTLGRADIFWNQIAALEDRARILAVSYPATGGIADWADDLADLCRARGFAGVTLLGSSLGGYLVQWMAETHGDLFTRVIAANTLHSALEIQSRPPYSSDLDHGPIDELRAGFGRGLTAWKESHPDQADLVDLLLAEVGGRIAEPELRNRLKALKNGPELPPVTFPAGRIATIEADDDPLIPPAMRAAVRARLAPSVAYRFLHGGHFPYVARPALYLGLLEEQLGLDVTGVGWGGGEVRAA